MKNIFGENLRRLRIAKNYTQEQAAQLLHISAKSLSRWECGFTMPDVMMLPDIARLYCVTVDDLYKKQSVVYENYAQRLLSVYEESRDPLDFYNAEREFDKLIKSGNYSMNDLRSYGILYQYHMHFCKDTALKLFEQGLALGEENNPEVYHQIERQRIFLRSQVGWNEKNIEEYRAKLAANPEDYYCHLNLLASYFEAGDNETALKVFENAAKKFPDQSLIYVYGGDMYRNLKRYDEAFACWDKVLELDPEVSDAMWSKGFCYEELGEYQKAYDMWNTIIAWLEERGFESEVELPRRLAQKCKEKIQE